MLEKFIKTYSGGYKYTTMIRHKGIVIAFAMGKDRRIWYTVLDVGGSSQDLGKTDQAATVLDVDSWQASPSELIFPNEIAEVGFGVAGQTTLPVFKKGALQPEVVGTVLPPGKPNEYDYYKSTTARFTAEAPFQVLSDGRYVYVFRQAIAGNGSLMVHLDKDGNLAVEKGTEKGYTRFNKTTSKNEWVKASSTLAPLVNSTLLVDRFLLVGTNLTPKMEVRYQRSRSKTRPASRKDSLGPKDLDGNFFYEPTQELKFIANLKDGRFSVLLLPTAIAEVQRWQIFAENGRTGRMDSYNVERSQEGLFNTRGSQTYTCANHSRVYTKQAGKCSECGSTLIPRLVNKGYSESALEFDGKDDHVRIPNKEELNFTKAVTIEAWIKPNEGLKNACIGGRDCYSLYINTDGKPAFAATIKDTPVIASSKFDFGVLKGKDAWVHIAGTFDGKSVRVFVNGNEDGNKELKGELPGSSMDLFIGRSPGDEMSPFAGIIDEVRLWQRARSSVEMKADMHQRLTGLEPGLSGYWRFDEGQGYIIHDQTNNQLDGTADYDEDKWTTSDAPVGEHPGIERVSFQIAGRTFTSPPTSLLYYQQNKAASGYSGEEKLLKSTGRVMLAAATNDGSTENVGKNHIAALDFSVSATGRLAQVPDELALSVVNSKGSTDQSLNKNLDKVSGWQRELAVLNGDITRLEDSIASLQALLNKLDQASVDPSSVMADITDTDYMFLNPKLIMLKERYSDLKVKKETRTALEDQLNNAEMYVYEHAHYQGRRIGPYKLGSCISRNDLVNNNLNDLISSIKLDGALQVKVYIDDRQGASAVITASASYVGNDWNDKISSMEVQENPAFKSGRDEASQMESTAQTVFDQAKGNIDLDREQLGRKLGALQGEKSLLESRRAVVQRDLSLIQDEVKNGASAVMPRLHTDPLGLTISGGLLGFAWTDDAPLLFDSATGTLALYFRGKDNQFFVAYYDTFTERAKVSLLSDGKDVVSCFSMSNAYEKITMQVKDAGNDADCTVLIFYGESTDDFVIKETWNNVPRAAQEFISVLNGQAIGRSYIGTGQKTKDGELTLLDQGARRAINTGTTLMVGNERVELSKQVFAGDKQIQFRGSLESAESLPIFFVEYDFPINAICEGIRADLSNGSMLIRAVAAGSSGMTVPNQIRELSISQVCKWTAAAPGSTIAFDGRSQVAEPDITVDLESFDADGDLTLEAWVKPTRVENQASVICHASANSRYILALEKSDVMSAMKFDGAKDYIVIPKNEALNIEGSITIEAWVKPEAIDGTRNIVAHGYPFTATGELVLRMENGHYEIGIWRRRNYLARIPIPEQDGNGLAWIHLAGVYDAETRQWILYRNGVPGASNVTNYGPYRIDADWGIGANANPDAAVEQRRFFKGAIDEVRIWKRARTQQEIQEDMNRRLMGSETDLVGYWHFESGEEKDYSANQWHGMKKGLPVLVLSPIPGYQVVAGVRDKFVQAREILTCGSWTHLAAAYRQAYGLRFDGTDDYLDCGNAESLNINGDLTIDVSFQVDELGRERVLLERTKTNDPSGQNVPYRLSISPTGKIVFKFWDVDGNPHPYESLTSIEKLKPQYVMVSRKRKTITNQFEDDKTRLPIILSWDEINIYVNSTSPSKTEKYTYDNNVKQAIDAIQQAKEAAKIDKTKRESLDSTHTLITPILNYPPGNLMPREMGRSDGALLIGKGSSGDPFQGTITELRIWNSGQQTSYFLSDAVDSHGLVSWWRFEERKGNKTNDSAGQNHATITGALWAENRDPQASSLKLYVNGKLGEVITVSGNAAGLRTGLGKCFEGEMEEVRIWQTTRTEEQIQDNLFRRIPGEKENLIAYYTFDATKKKGTITDYSLRGNHLIGGVCLFSVEGGVVQDLINELNSSQVSDGLRAQFKTHGVTLSLTTVIEMKQVVGNKWKIVDADQTYLILSENQTLHVYGNANYVLSTAPIGEDTPQVRSALAGIRTPFSDKIGSTPAVQEYGDMQYDNQGNLIGIFKRCYSYILDGAWKIITGYKVGDMVTEWIGQVQFAPQLMGFIEGAPPVPSENLTQPSVELVGDLDDYNQASSIELAEAGETTCAYSATKESGNDLEVDLGWRFGFASKTEGGAFLISTLEDSKVLFGFKGHFEASQSWSEQASMGVSRASGRTTSLELRGRYTTPAETTSAREPFGRRFVPDNVGLALVQSETADVFALRLQHNRALIAYQMRANPDVPRDWNIIHFPINPRYVKQGTLDGKIGSITDADYVNALKYSSDSSYFKPIEAYALKNRIQREETALQTYYAQYAAKEKGNPALFSGLISSVNFQEIAGYQDLKQILHHNLVNTYVWTTDGGLFTETQQTMDVQSETYGGSYDFKGMYGGEIKIGFHIWKVASALELSAMYGSHQHLSVNKTKESKTSFQLNVNLDKVERDIYKRSPNDRAIVLLDESGKPIKHPGKVDAYRFMSFYLEPESDYHEQFYNLVVDPIWLEQSDDPGAVALREARQPGKKPPCWRVLHRVTYVSRVLPPLDRSAPPSLEKTLQTLDIDSNYELIKQMEPYVRDHLTDFADFSQTVDDALNAYMQELIPHKKEVKEYLSLYYGLDEGYLPEQQVEGFGEGPEGRPAPNKPPTVEAGQYAQPILLVGESVEWTPDLNQAPDSKPIVRDDRIAKIEDLFLTWEFLPGTGQKATDVEFKDRHILNTTATFTNKGVYRLRLTASDGVLSASDETMLVVNERPVIETITEGEREHIENGNSCWKVGLTSMIQSGLGNLSSGEKAQFTWIFQPDETQMQDQEDVAFDTPNAPDTIVTFRKKGQYQLYLEVKEGGLDAKKGIIIGIDEMPEIIRAGAGVPECRFDNDTLCWIVELNCTVQSGLGRPEEFAAKLKTAWEVVSGSHNVVIEIKESAPHKDDPSWLDIKALATFHQGGVYQLRFTVVNQAFGLTATSEIIGLEFQTRVIKDLQALYLFETGQGATVFDVSGMEAPLDIVASTADDMRWVPGGVTVQSRAVLSAAVDRLTRSIKRSNAITLEAWIKPPEGYLQESNSPLRRILTLSGGPAERNFILAQRGKAYHVGLRTTDGSVTDENASLKSLEAGVVEPGLTHIAFTRDANGNATLYKNGEVVSRRIICGDFSDWDEGFHSALANEFNSNGVYDRTWSGEYHLVAIYNRALSFEEVKQNFDFGADHDRLPHVFAGENCDINWSVEGVKKERGTCLRVPMRGRVVHDRSAGEITVNWQKVSGPGMVTFVDPNDAATVAEFSRSGNYILRLTASGGEKVVSRQMSVNIFHEEPVVSIDIADTKLIAARDEVSSITLVDGAASLSLNGAVRNSCGEDYPCGKREVEWTCDPENVAFDDAHKINPTVMFTKNGIYVLTLTARNTDESHKSDSDSVVITVNEIPVVEAGPDQMIVLPKEAILDATVSDDGLPISPGILDLAWEDVSKDTPGKAIFANPKADYTTVRFTDKGTYQLKLSAYDGAATGGDEVTIIVNKAPVVDAGKGGTVKYNEPIPLKGVILDNGFGNENQSRPLDIVWIMESGPEQPGFSNPNALETEVTFSRKGIYVLKVTVSTEYGEGSDTVTFIVNQPVMFSAGSDQTTSKNSLIALHGSITDDGLGDPERDKDRVSISWVLDKGPSGSTIGNNTILEPTVTIAKGGQGVGTYVFRLTVTNPSFSTSDSVTVTVK